MRLTTAAGWDSSGEFVSSTFTKLNASAYFSDSFFGLANQRYLLRTDMQYSNDLLLVLEQMSLGGPDSVRAFSPGEYQMGQRCICLR